MLDHAAEIANPSLVIANITTDAELSMTLTVRRGLGYEPATQREQDGAEDRPIGKLPLDASYSPVRRVAMDVQSARVEQRTDLDRLVIDLETNGTIDPKAAIQRAARSCATSSRASSPWRGDGTGGWVRSTPREPPSIPSCCGRWTTWSSRCARPTA
jgi:DNA-directed RNA polymerase alpha subunit